MVIGQATTAIAAPLVQMLTSVALAASTIAPPAAAQHDPSAVRVLIVLVPTGDVAAPAAIMRHEVHRMWRPAGVEFRWVKRLTDAAWMPDRVMTVRVADHTADRVDIPAGARGAVPIVAGRMRQVIFVSPSAVKAFVSSSGAAGGGGPFDTLYARMVGRVIAPELGHLL